MRFTRCGLFLFAGSVILAQQADLQLAPSAAAKPAAQTGAPRHGVNPRNSYHRILCVVPLVGAGTRQDPRRPMYAPVANGKVPSLAGIIGFQQIPTDDKKFAIVEFVAADAAALQPILNDKSLRIFERGKQSQSAIEQEIKLVRKDFDFSKFGIAVR